MVVVLAYDLGASSGRLTAQHFDGNKMRVKEIHRFSNEPLQRGDNFFWDYPQIVQQLQTGLDKVVGEPCNSVGVDTWGVDFGCLNARGQLIGNPYSYRDLQSEPFVESMKQFISPYELYQRTGNEISSINTLFQLKAIQNLNPHILKDSKDILLMPSLFIHALSGEKVNEFTIASTTQLVNLQKKNWDNELITKAFGSNLPLSKIGTTHEIVGQLINFPKLKMVMVPGHDTACALSALPIEDRNSIFISLGTWGIIGTELEKPIISLEAFEQGFTNEGTSEKTIRFQKNATGFWILQKLRKEWQEKLTFEQEALAYEQAEHLNSIINPEDESFFNPKSMIAAINLYCERTNQPQLSSIGQYIRCFCESIALYYSKVIEDIEKLSKKQLSTVYIGGGGTQNELLCQLFANASGKRVVAGPVEASSIGNGLSQLRALNEIGSIEEGRQVVKTSFNVKEYEPLQVDKWKIMKEKYNHLF